MQAVILAAGEGKRMRPLTLERPKPLVLIGGRPLLEHIIDALPDEIDELIMIVGYKGDMIKAHFGDSYQGRPIRYVRQWMAAGTAHALSMAEPYLHDERFLLMNADDLHGTAALSEALSHPLAILAAEHPEPSKFGVLSVREDGTLAGVIEKPEVPESNLISTGAMVLDKRIFTYPVVPHAHTSEYYMTYPLNLMVQEHPVEVVQQDFWIPVGSPEDIPVAEAALSVHVPTVSQGG